MDLKSCRDFKPAKTGKQQNDENQGIQQHHMEEQNATAGEAMQDSLNGVMAEEPNLEGVDVALGED